MGKRGRTPITYTLERAGIVRSRVHAGERLTAVCAELKMNVSNFLRWCRRNHFVVNTPEMRGANRNRKRGPYAGLGQTPAKVRRPREGGRAARIAADLRAGLAPHAVAELHGVSYGYVVRLRHEIAAAPPAGPGRNTVKSPGPRAHLRDRNSTIVTAYKTGTSTLILARLHNLTRSRVYQIVTAYSPVTTK